MPSRRDFIRFLGASSSYALVGRAFGEASAAVPAPGVKPNVILVLADQWRPSALDMGPANDNSYAGAGKQKLATPRLKDFGEEGMRLDRCYATKPVCTPNRSAILTGLYPHESGMFNNNLMLPPDIPCMTDVFKDAGYRTYYLGKWHMDGAGKGTSGTPAAGFIPKNWRRRGLDRVDGMNRGHSYFANSFMLDDDGTVMPVPPADPSGTLDEQLADFEPHRQTDLTLDYLTDHEANHADEPFFIWLNYGPPHTPFTPPAPFDKYSGDMLTPRPNNANASDMEALANYFGLCEALDYEFGRLLDRLHALGMAEDTIVVFSADHGEMMGSHGQVRKGQSPDESWRVPFLARWPGQIATNAFSDVPFSSADIMPTLLGMCGLDIPDSVSGSDKSGLLRGQSIAETPVFGENEGSNANGNWRGIVKRVGGTPFKYVVRFDSGTDTMLPPELFDLDSDPFELDNLAGDGVHDAIEAELAADLAAWRASTGDTYWPDASTPRAAATYPDTAPLPETIETRMVRKDDGKHYLQVKSRSRIYFTMQESPDLNSGSWTDVGPARHGNGNTLNFEVPEPPVSGLPRMFYRVKAESTAGGGGGETTDFIEGGDIAGSSTADWSNGVPNAARPGTIGLDITSGTMGAALVDADITQLGGTILVNSGTASTRPMQGATRYTLVGGTFRRTTAHVLRIGQNTADSDVVFSVVGGLLDVSATAGADGLVFMGTNSVLKVSGGAVDASGGRVQLHSNSSHTDTPMIDFEAEGDGSLICEDLGFAADRLGYVNFGTGSTGTLTVTGTVSNNGVALTGTRAEQFEGLWTAGRLRLEGANAGAFGDVFQVNGETLSLK